MKDKTVIANPALAHSNGATSAACTRRRHGRNVGEISIWAEGPDHAIMNGHSRVPERHREPLWRPGNFLDSTQTLIEGCPFAVVDVMASFFGAMSSAFCRGYPRILVILCMAGG